MFSCTPRPPLSPITTDRPPPSSPAMSQYPADLERKGSEKGSHDHAHVTEGSVIGHGASGEHMHRSLKGRQVSMIAIAGTIGTGLFLCVKLSYLAKRPITDVSWSAGVPVRLSPTVVPWVLPLVTSSSVSSSVL